MVPAVQLLFASAVLSQVAAYPGDVGGKPLEMEEVGDKLPEMAEDREKREVEAPKTGNISINISSSNTLSNISSHIVLGKDTVRTAFPWMVHLRLDDKSQCGGALISVLWVVTAAHCIVPYSKIVVTLGAYDMSRVEEGRRVYTITSNSYKIPHPQYNSASLANDIALLKLPPGLPTTETTFIKPIRLPRSISVAASIPPYEGQAGTLIGWGSSYKGGAMSKTLNLMVQRIISNAECAKMYGTSSMANEVMCTSGQYGPNACDGDSGSPLMVQELYDYKFTLVGVASFVYGGRADCGAGYPAGYARITSYVTWILKSTGIGGVTPR